MVLFRISKGDISTDFEERTFFALNTVCYYPQLHPVKRMYVPSMRWQITLRFHSPTHCCSAGKTGSIGSTLSIPGVRGKGTVMPECQ